MTATPQVCGELIGLPVSIVRADNPALNSISGVVVDETKHFLTVDTPNGRKRVPKSGAVFRFTVNGKDVDIDGRDIEVAPEERIKLKVHHGRSNER
jgi:ribonuclease P protein subunit POP4